MLVPYAPRKGVTLVTPFFVVYQTIKALEVDGEHIKIGCIFTGKEENYFIVLLSPAMEILKKYDYVLPIISNQQYNLRLKIVADYAGLDRNLTVHMSRHTFATMCLNNGVKMENVSKMLGHTNVRTTQQYAKVLNAEVEKDFEMLERILS